MPLEHLPQHDPRCIGFPKERLSGGFWHGREGLRLFPSIGASSLGDEIRSPCVSTDRAALNWLPAWFVFQPLSRYKRTKEGQKHHLRCQACPAGTRTQTPANQVSLATEGPAASVQPRASSTPKQFLLGTLQQNNLEVDPRLHLKPSCRASLI